MRQRSAANIRASVAGGGKAPYKRHRFRAELHPRGSNGRFIETPDDPKTAKDKLRSQLKNPKFREKFNKLTPLQQKRFIAVLNSAYHDKPLKVKNYKLINEAEKQQKEREEIERKERERQERERQESISLQNKSTNEELRIYKKIKSKDAKLEHLGYKKPEKTITESTDNSTTINVETNELNDTKKTKYTKAQIEERRKVLKDYGLDSIRIDKEGIAKIKPLIEIAEPVAKTSATIENGKFALWENSDKGDHKYGFNRTETDDFEYKVKLEDGEVVALNTNKGVIELAGVKTYGVPSFRKDYSKAKSETLINQLVEITSIVESNIPAKGLQWQKTNHGVIDPRVLGNRKEGVTQLHHINQWAKDNFKEIINRYEEEVVTLKTIKEKKERFERLVKDFEDIKLPTNPLYPKMIHGIDIEKGEQDYVLLPGNAHDVKNRRAFELNHPKGLDLSSSLKYEELTTPEGKLTKNAVKQYGLPTRLIAKKENDTIYGILLDENGSETYKSPMEKVEKQYRDRAWHDWYRENFWREYYKDEAKKIASEIDKRMKLDVSKKEHLSRDVVQQLWETKIEKYKDSWNKLKEYNKETKLNGKDQLQWLSEASGEKEKTLTREEKAEQKQKLVLEKEEQKKKLALEKAEKKQKLVLEKAEQKQKLALEKAEKKQ
jgi:hypothetical protein